MNFLRGDAGGFVVELGFWDCCDFRRGEVDNGRGEEGKKTMT